MAKIPFDIKYRPQIESREYKVETNDHHPVAHPMVGKVPSISM